MRWPLRNQILLPMTCLMAATLMIVSSVDAFLAARGARREIESKLADVSDTLASANYPLTDAVLRQMRGFSGAEFALVGPAGDMIAASREFSNAAWPTASPGDALSRRVAIDGEHYFHTVATLNRRPQSGRETLHIFYPERTYQDAWRLAVWPPLIVGAMALVLVLMSGAMIAARVALPLRRLRDQVNRIAGGDFAEVTLPVYNDEIADLSRAVNEMARMLQSYEANVRRSEQLRTLGKLGGGIAHQIRNSLTGCRMALDLHGRQCAAADDESLQVAGQQLALMEEYIQRFLSLGRSSEEPHREFDVREAVERAVLLVKPMARHSQVELRQDLPADPVVVLGVSNEISQLVVNLLLNAVEAASAGAPAGNSRQVEATMTADGSRVRVEVRDNGPGPSAEIASELFEPLVSNKRDGIGLGLSVAKSIAEQHRGSLAWRRNEGQTCFELTLPRQGKQVEGRSN